MKAWLRLTLITMTVGGGLSGFTATLQQLSSFQSQPPASSVLMVGFLGLYAMVTISGLLFVQDQRRIVPLIIALAIQIPWVSSPIFAYRFTAAFHLTIGLIGGKLNGGFRLGSDWQCSLFQKLPWGVGVNLFTLLIVILLARSIRTPCYEPDAAHGKPSES